MCSAPNVAGQNVAGTGDHGVLTTIINGNAKTNSIQDAMNSIANVGSKCSGECRHKYK